MSYLTAEQEDSVNAAMYELHNFFADRNTLFAIKEDSQTILTQNPEHNYYYSSPTNPDNTTTVINRTTGSFTARLYYPKGKSNQQLSPLDFTSNTVNNNINLPDGTIKIVTDITGKQFLEDADRILWDDGIFQKKSPENRHGLLQKNFYTYYLIPNE